MSKTIAERMAELADAKNELAYLEVRAKKESRALTASEQAEYERLLKRGEQLAAEIEYEEERGERMARSVGAGLARGPLKLSPGPAIHTRSSRPYSLVRAVNAMVSGDWSDADVEARVSAEIAEQRGEGPKHPRGMIVPMRALLPRDVEQRVVAKATPNSSGVALIQTDVLVDELIEYLRAELVVGKAGARILPGLVGDVQIPRQSAGATAAFVANEDTAVAESTPSFDSVTLSPKTLGLKATLTRRMLKQALAIEDLVRSDIRQAVALAIDTAALTGSGAGGNPTGIVNVGGIGGVTTGGAVTRAHLLEFEADLATANALRGKTAFVMRPAVKSILKGKVMATGTAVYMMADDGTVIGQPSFSSQTMPANNLLFGNFEELLIGMWGELDLFADPYSVGDKGHVILRGFQDVDVAVRHAASFSLATDVTG